MKLYNFDPVSGPRKTFPSPFSTYGIFYITLYLGLAYFINFSVVLQSDIIISE